MASLDPTHAREYTQLMMKSVPEVSVIMSVHNGERYLRQAVDSILAQTFGDFELIIVDDGSTDQTAVILDSYADQRIVRLRNEDNLGLTRSLNLGLAQARGDYLARMDADDVSHPLRLEKQLQAIQSQPAPQVVFTCYQMIDQAGQVVQAVPIHLTPEAIYLELWFNNCLVHGTALLPRRLLVEAGGYDETFARAQDYELWNRLKNQVRFLMLPEVLYSRRDHPAAASRAQLETQDACSQRVRLANLQQLTGGKADTWDDEALTLLRAVETRQAAGNTKGQLRATLASLLDKICRQAPPFLGPGSLAQAVADYKHRFEVSTVVIEQEAVHPPAVAEVLLRKAEANLALLPARFIEEYQATHLTIVMLSWNRLELTRRAIQSLQDHVQIPYRLLLIDNRSTDQVRQQLQEISSTNPAIQLILLDENLGCGGGRRYALDHVTTEYVMFLDNDIEVFPGTIEHLLCQLAAHPEAQACTGQVVFLSGQVHLCGGDYTDRDSILFYERLGAGRPFDDPAIGQSGACRWVNGGSTVFRIQSLRQYPYDPALHSYYEDFEWCYRLNQVGVGRFYRSVESLFLHHHVPKVPDATSTPYEFKLKAMPYIQSIAQFFQTHGLIIQNLFDFVPELVAADHKLMVGPAKVLLQWINTYGGQWVLKQWQLGQLAPLFTGQVSSYQEWLDWLQLALPFDQYQHYKMIQDLANQLEKHHCTLESLLTQLGKRQRVAEALSAQLAQRRQVVQTLEAQVQTMKTELTTRQQEFAETKARLIESECMVQLISAQLADTTRRLHSIYHSRYWRMMSLYWRAQGLAGRIGRRAARPKTD